MDNLVLSKNQPFENNQKCNCKSCRQEDVPIYQKEIIGNDGRIGITNTTSIPFRFICNIEYEGWAIGTGTLINQRTILTAGHVVVDQNKKKLDKSKFRIIPGRSGSHFPWGHAKVEEIFVANGYSPTTSTDFAIIRLKEPIGRKVGYWGKDQSTKFYTGGTLDILNVCGYPADKPSTNSLKCWDKNATPYNRCHHTPLQDGKRNRICGTSQFGSFDGVVVSISPSGIGKLIHYTSDTCPGNSGCPVWQYFPSNKSRVLVGVHVAGDDGVGSLANRAVLIDQNVSAFIKQYAV